jgi:RNA polymerase sigma factor (sigma-70 family)
VLISRKTKNEFPYFENRIRREVNPVDLSPSDMQRIEQQFDHFCKIVLSNEAKDMKKLLDYRLKHEKCFSELTPEEEKQLYKEDKYEIFDWELPAFDFTIHIHNELLYEALSSLPESKRNVVVLSYWFGLSDKQIAKQLHLPRTTASHIRTSSIGKLKKLMEVKSNGT